MWSDASLEASKVEATKDALSRLQKPPKPAKVKAEVKKLHWQYYQAFPQRWSGDDGSKSKGCKTVTSRKSIQRGKTRE
jgi:hypothetical protein